jgi:hypothetical protein
MIAGLRYFAARSAILESMDDSLSDTKWKADVTRRVGQVMNRVWDEKKKNWELAFSTRYHCLPNGHDPRPKSGE